MSAKRKTTVAVIFGGRSVEHDVSIVTGHQIMQAFDQQRYEIVPVYISGAGRWYTGEPLLNLKNFENEIISAKGIEEVLLSPSTQHHGLIVNPMAGRLQKSSIRRLDVAFPAVHGSHGEDGTLQGLLEMADIPYVGCGVLASALANDKILTKRVLRQHGIDVVDDVTFTRRQWLEAREAVLKRIENTLTCPVFVKPATLGSSIGVARVSDSNLLAPSIDVAANFDQRVVVEQAVTDATEINCSVMGYDDQMRASVLEQPVSWEEFLTYEEKYMRGEGGMKSQQRIIPAPLPDDLTELTQQTAIRAFRAIEGRGIARMDFLLSADKTTVYLNEINTMPGSLSFYLWQEEGLSNNEVVEQLIKIAQDAHADKRSSTFDYQTNLVALTAQRGLKGAKGSKKSV